MSATAVPAARPGGLAGARHGLAALLALAAALLFAVNGTVSKLVLEAGMSSLRLVELRSVGAAACLFALALATRPRALRAGPRELAFLAVFGVTGIAFVQWFYFVAIARLPVGIALLIQFTAPLMIALWVRFVRGEPVRARVWAALALCLVGLSLVAQVWTGFTLDGIGVLAAFGAALALATYFLLGERGLGRRDALSLSAWTFAFSGLLWSLVQPWWTFPVDVLARDVALPGPFDGLPVPVWSLTVCIVLLGTVAPFLLVLAAIKQLGPARVGLIGMASRWAPGWWPGWCSARCWTGPSSSGPSWSWWASRRPRPHDGAAAVQEPTVRRARRRYPKASHRSLLAKLGQPR